MAMATQEAQAQAQAQGTREYIPLGCLIYPLDERLKISRRFQSLVNNEWIRVEPGASRDNHNENANRGITRVHVLADDLGNRRINRDSPTLKRRKKELLSLLNFSSTVWAGLSSHNDPSTSQSAFPRLTPRAQAIVAEDKEDLSLLKMFNTIPSPNPDIKLIQDDLPREFMSNLLASTVDGLVTEMYPYQCRSAALMHQREVHSSRFLDPRLIEVFDQRGDVYYHNPVTGDSFREPRYYDTVRGGILAEEMGAGKTLICLALITATRHQPASVPDLYQGSNITIRPKVGSLMDMAAAVATKHSCPWKSYIDPRYEYCIKAIQENPGWYHLPRPVSRRLSRGPAKNLSPYKIYLSHATLIVVPANLLKQWGQEITKHTRGLKVHVLNTKSRRQIPKVTELVRYDIILCSSQSLEMLWQENREPELDGSWTFDIPLGLVRFKRCIVDEGHKLGNAGLSGVKTDLLQALDSLHTDARWTVTGTPSQGLFGVEEGGANNTALAAMTNEQEKKDLERIGAIATSFLKARPWSNTIMDNGDTPAEWRVYVLQPKHGAKSSGRRDCLRSTFNSLIIRHRLSEVSHLLPAVDAKIVKLDGSYQDKLSLNLFSMMIIFNAVQSQRTDQDYFFHPRNRKNLLQLVLNLRQASFFGGSFFSVEDIQKAVQTAEDFIEKKGVHIEAADGELLKAAIDFGKMAMQNKVKQVANLFHEMPIYIQHFPGGMGSSWSMDKSGDDDADLVCTNSRLMIAAQKTMRPFLDSPEELNTYLNSGSFVRTGTYERDKEIKDAQPQEKPKSVAETTLAGNTKLGEDHVSPRKRHSAPISSTNAASGSSIPTPPQTPEETIQIAAPLAETQLISTTSAKLSYLIDAIVTYQKDEQIIIFYENDNVAWYLAAMLEMLNIHLLIYAKGLSTERRAAYVATFNASQKFRVLLMDISQAAFGLDMRSASRIYFINPVLNPQVEAQAIGRARRISQQRRVTVETLVLKDSLEEVLVERKQSMTQAEHRKCKTILDDQSIYEWILNPKIIPLPAVDVADGPAQMARLEIPQFIFGREFGRETGHPDENILLEDPASSAAAAAVTDDKYTEEDAGVTTRAAPATTSKTKFGRMAAKVHIRSPGGSGASSPVPSLRLTRPGKKRARFAGDEIGEASSASGASTPMPTPTPIPGDESPVPTAPRPAKRARFAGD